MNKTEIEKIAKAIAQATAQWLADKRKERQKISPLFSESHLIIPAAEYLIDDNWDKLGTEKHSAELFEKGNAGDVNYDLSATKDNETLLIEMKLLKKTNEPRLIKDFVKLAFPTNGSGYSSLYLIAESTITPSKSKLIQELSIKGEKYRFHLAHIKGAAKNENYVKVTQDAKDVTQGENNLWKLKGDELKSVLKIMDIDPPLSEFTVECAANETIGNDRVIILTVQR